MKAFRMGFALPFLLVFAIFAFATLAVVHVAIVVAGVTEMPEPVARFQRWMTGRGPAQRPD